MKKSLHILFIFAVVLVGCSSNQSKPEISPTEAIDQQTPTPAEEKDIGLSDLEIKTLNSLEMVDNYPLYIMKYSADYNELPQTENDVSQSYSAVGENTWACTLFSAFADEENMLYGRNFDWEYSPALLLYTDPPGGYASVSMVDIAYLGFTDDEVIMLDELPLDERISLLRTPWWPFDGMNEHGLVVGMAAVSSGDMTIDPQKPTLGSLEVIRKILDEARDVDEAVNIFQSHNIEMGGGPDLHYLIADRTGKAALVEFYAGKMYVIPNEVPWHLATNFLCSSTSGLLEGNCQRYDRVLQEMEGLGGYLDVEQAISLLGEVSHPRTQWSMIYEMSTGKVDVVMGREFAEVHTFDLDMPDK